MDITIRRSAATESPKDYWTDQENKKHLPNCAQRVIDLILSIGGTSVSTESLFPRGKKNTHDKDLK